MYIMFELLYSVGIFQNHYVRKPHGDRKEAVISYIQEKMDIIWRKGQGSSILVTMIHLLR